MTGFHVVTDLDGTWLPGPGQAADLRCLEAAIRDCPGAVLTFATGRTFIVALEAIAQYDLMLPHYLITDVGTALFHRAPGGGWAEDAGWTERILEVWDPEGADALVARGLPPSVQLQPGVAPIRRLALQRADGQDMARGERELTAACAAVGLRADILPSHDLYFDVLPRGVHKGAALAFLQASMALPRPTVGCGDSANDLGLFKAADHPVLMLGGLADAEVPAEVLGRALRGAFPGPRGIHQALVDLGLLKPILEGVHGH